MKNVSFAAVVGAAWKIARFGAFRTRSHVKGDGNTAVFGGASGGFGGARSGGTRGGVVGAWGIGRNTCRSGVARRSDACVGDACVGDACVGDVRCSGGYGFAFLGGGTTCCGSCTFFVLLIGKKLIQHWISFKIRLCWRKGHGGRGG